MSRFFCRINFCLTLCNSIYLQTKLFYYANDESEAIES